jgi:hypothetical protein
MSVALVVPSASAQQARAACTTTFAVLDSAGAPVAGARARLRLPGPESTERPEHRWLPGASGSDGRLASDVPANAVLVFVAPGYAPSVAPPSTDRCGLVTVVLRPGPPSIRTLATVKVRGVDTLSTQLIIPFQAPTGHGESLLRNGEDPPTAGVINGDFERVAATVPGLNRGPNGISAYGLPSSANQLLLDGLPVSSLQLPRDVPVLGRAGTSANTLAGGFAGAVVNAGVVPASYRQLDVRVSGVADARFGSAESLVQAQPSVNVLAGTPLPGQRGGLTVAVNAADRNSRPAPWGDPSLLAAATGVATRLGLPVQSGSSRASATQVLSSLLLQDVAGGVYTSTFRLGRNHLTVGAFSTLQQWEEPTENRGTDVAWQNRWKRLVGPGTITVAIGGTRERRTTNPSTNTNGGWFDLASPAVADPVRIAFGAPLTPRTVLEQSLVRSEARWDQWSRSRRIQHTVIVEPLVRWGNQSLSPASTLPRVGVDVRDSVRVTSWQVNDMHLMSASRLAVLGAAYNVAVDAPRTAWSFGARLDAQGALLGGTSGSRRFVADVSPRFGVEHDVVIRRRYVAKLQADAGRFVGWFPLDQALAMSQQGLQRTAACEPVQAVRLFPVPQENPCGGGVVERPVTSDVNGPVRPPSTWRAGAEARWFALRGQVWLYLKSGVSRTENLPAVSGSNLVVGAAPGFQDADGRWVFASPASIRPSSGVIDPAQGLHDPAKGFVSSFSTSGVMESAQVTVGVLIPSAWRVNINASVTRGWGRQTVQGIADGRTNGGASPVWAPIAALPTYVAKLRLNKSARPFGVSGFLEWATGDRFTPSAGGDLNGDGVQNDPVRGVGPLPLGLGPNDVSCLSRATTSLAAPMSCVGPPRLSTTLRLTYVGDLLRFGRDIELALDVGDVFTWINAALPSTVDALSRAEQVWFDPVAYVPVGFDASRRQFAFAPNPAFGQGTAAWQAARARRSFVRLEGRVSFAASRSQQDLERFTRARTQAQAMAAMSALSRRWFYDPVEPLLASTVAQSLSLDVRRQLIDARRQYEADFSSTWRRAAEARSSANDMRDQERIVRQAERISVALYEKMTSAVRSALGDALQQFPSWMVAGLKPEASRSLLGFQADD